MGSKNRIAKYLLPIILKDRKPDQAYVELFVGGANMIDKVDGLRIGSDINKNVILGLINIRDDIEILPKTKKDVTEENYKNVRNNKNHKLHGYYAFQLSYGGKEWGGYCRDKALKRDYIAEGYRNAIKQNPNLQGVRLLQSEYSISIIPEKSILYCDPPYQGATNYKTSFDHDLFWRWCRDKVKEGPSVFISEYSAPEDFICVWEKEINSSLTKNTGGKKGVEKLFIHKTQHESLTTV